MRLSEGLPSDVSAKDVWDVALLRREQRRSELMALGLSICASVSVNLGGGSTAEVVRPFYTSTEWDEIERQREESLERVAQAQQVAKLRRIEKRWQTN